MALASPKVESPGEEGSSNGVFTSAQILDELPTISDLCRIVRTTDDSIKAKSDDEVLKAIDQARLGGKLPLVPRARALLYDIYDYLNEKGRRQVEKLLGKDLRILLKTRHHPNLYHAVEDPPSGPSRAVSQTTFEKASDKFNTTYDFRPAKELFKKVSKTNQPEDIQDLVAAAASRSMIKKKSDVVHLESDSGSSNSTFYSEGTEGEQRKKTEAKLKEKTQQLKMEARNKAQKEDREQQIAQQEDERKKIGAENPDHSGKKMAKEVLKIMGERAEENDTLTSTSLISAIRAAPKTPIRAPTSLFLTSLAERQGVEAPVNSLTSGLLLDEEQLAIAEEEYSSPFPTTASYHGTRDQGNTTSEGEHAHQLDTSLLDYNKRYSVYEGQLGEAWPEVVEGDKEQGWGSERKLRSALPGYWGAVSRTTQTKEAKPFTSTSRTSETRLPVPGGDDPETTIYKSLHLSGDIDPTSEQVKPTISTVKDPNDTLEQTTSQRPSVQSRQPTFAELAAELTTTHPQKLNPPTSIYRPGSFTAINRRLSGEEMESQTTKKRDLRPRVEDKAEAKKTVAESVRMEGVTYDVKVYKKGGPVGTKVATKQGSKPAPDVFTDWPVVLEPFDWSDYRKDDSSTWPPEFVRLTDVLAAEVVHHEIPPAKRAARWSADFDSSGWLRKSRPNFGPASKREVVKKNKSKWYNDVWKETYEFVGGEGREDDQVAFLKDGKNWKGATWTVGQLSASQKKPWEDFDAIKVMKAYPKPPIATGKESGNESEDTKPKLKKRKSEGRPPPEDRPLRSVEGSSSSMGHAHSEREQKRAMRTIVGEGIGDIMDKVGRLSARLDATIEAMKDMGEATMVNEVVNFTKDTKSEVEALKKAPKEIFKKVAKETDPLNADWLYSSMKAKMPERKYENLTIEDDWDSLTKRVKYEREDSPPPPGDLPIPNWLSE